MKTPHPHTIPKEIIAQYLPSAPIIIEAGGHIGRDTAKLAHYFPKGHIYSFEPVPELFEQLKKNTEGLSNVTIFNTALAEKSGLQKFYKSSGRSTATSSLYKPYEYAKEFPTTLFEEIQVPCISLDEWSQKNDIKKIDFMWFDMQGGELNALRGAQSLLPEVTAIYTEVALTERYKDNPLYHELKDFLHDYNFSVKIEALGKETWGNVLFVRQ